MPIRTAPPLVRRAAPLAVIAAVLALAACAPGDDIAAEDPVGDGEQPTVSDPSELVDDVCLEAYPLAALSTADMGELTLMPADWPAPPEDAVLCATDETTREEIDGTTMTLQNADYALDAPIEDILAHYEAALGAYDPQRTAGEENGTGYETLDGSTGDVEFQLRETDGGFTLLFAEAGA